MNFKNQIFNKNNLEILALIPNETIDLTITSPPYDNLRDYQGYSFDFSLFKKIVPELFRIAKKGGVVVWIVGDSTINGSETGMSFKQALFFKEIGFNLHDTMIYQKSGFSNPSTQHKRYHQIFEYMFIFSKGKPKTFNPLKDRKNKTQYDFGKGRRKKDGSMTHQGDKTRIKLNEYGMRFNIWRYKTGKGNSTKDRIAFKHSAICPENLVKDHILSWSNEKDLVLDCFNGVGTTTKMAYLLNRNYIGIEISKEYCDIAEERIKNSKKSN